jgi:hypothetical protein
MLPDDVFLDMFDFYRINHDYSSRPVWEWHVLAEVCQRWRQIVFASPHRLNLQILCTHGSPVKKNLRIWPAFPIVLSLKGLTPYDEVTAINALEHLDRVRDVRFEGTGSELGRMVTMMQKPFPVLTRLRLVSLNETLPVLPAEFLGGSAPCLQEITLCGIPLPALPTLLMSAGDLVTLNIYNIPRTGYISPETMVACLAALPRLESITIGFQWATPCPGQICQPPLTWTVLPALTSFDFKGASEYLEVLVTPIDSPQLNWIFIHYLNQLVDFQVPQLSKFIDRSMGPRLLPPPLVCARISICNDRVIFDLCRNLRPFWTTISCEVTLRHVSRMAQVLGQFSATLSTVVQLALEDELEQVCPLEGTDYIAWLHLLLRFPAMQRLFIHWELTGLVALALEDIAGETVLPCLDLICLDDRPATSVEKFVAVRRLSGRPVTVVDTECEFMKRVKSYYSE